MPITRSAADAFPYTEESSNPDSQSFATFESERTDIDDDESFVPATQDGSGDELEFFDLEDLETVDEEDFDEVDGEETEGELNGRRSIATFQALSDKGNRWSRW